MSGPFPGAFTARDQSREQEHTLRCALVILLAYLTVMLGPVAQWSLRASSADPVAMHLAAIGLVALAYVGRLPSVVRYWTPLALGPFLYLELRWLVAGGGRPHADLLVANWERATFPANPSATLALALHSVVLSEVLHAAYLSYYALIFVPPVLLWLAHRRQAFSRTLLALAVVYALCFTIYVLFPVDGPRFLHGPANAPDGPVRSFVIALLESGSSRGTAFPSSHVAASLVASVCALRFQRAVGLIVALLTAGICVGAVYGGYHYAIDIVAGLLTGVLSLVAAFALEKQSPRARSPLKSARARRCR